MQGVRSSSRMFYACLACTIQFDTGSTEGKDHHPVCKENLEYMRMEEEYLCLLNDKPKTELKQHQSSGVMCHSHGLYQHKWMYCYNKVFTVSEM